jgi:molybdenum cofactor guanylyltransferase
VGALAAVVLAGGRGSRLGGVDKPALVMNGRTLLDGVLDACGSAVAIVVVGPRRATAVPVHWVREDPPHTGPLAALAAGLAAVPAGAAVTAVLAADLPGLRQSTVRRLVAALTGDVDGALLVDGAGESQWLAGGWWTAALRDGLAALGEPAGRPLRALLGGLVAVRLPAVGDEALDVDVPADLDRAIREASREAIREQRQR